MADDRTDSVNPPQQEERIGPYRVHPVASMFPLIEGVEFEKLVGSIQAHGLIHPIVVQGDVLFDGRNRLRACLSLDIEPVIEEYAGKAEPHRYIIDANLHRRDLSKEQRGMIFGQIRLWWVAQRNALKQKQGKSEDGTAGGRGRKKQPAEEQGNPETISSPGLAEPKTHAKDARSTVGQIAEGAKVSQHVARQVVTVLKHAPELADDVAKGKAHLKEAEKAAKSKKPAAKKKAPFKAERWLKSTVALIRKRVEACPQSQRAGIVRELMEHLRDLWQK